MVGTIAAVTFAGWFLPVSYHVLGHAYLLVVILLSVRVGRTPALLAAVVSSVAWNYVFIPPKLSFSVLDLDDGVLLGSYFVVAIIAGQLTARIRLAELHERQRERRARTLFHLTRALADARTLDQGVGVALRQADALFDAETALLLMREQGGLEVHPASSFALTEKERAVAEWTVQGRREAGKFADVLASAEAMHLPLVGDKVLGVFVVRLPDTVSALSPVQRDLLESFAHHIAVMIEREQLRAAGEREKFFAESDRLHRTLLDSVSHELKTPLAVLRTVAARLGTEDQQKRGMLISEMQIATSRLDHLVANLLDQTRLEAGGLRPQLDWCDLKDIVRTARNTLAEALDGHDLNIDLPSNLPLCKGDEGLLEQVVTNLLLNASRHTPAGTRITVTAGRETRNYREWMFLRVTDHGPGIPKELREELFQKFHRGPSAPTGGLGLGLSIVRGFMRAQGGDVVASETSGGGATFTIYLPYVANEVVPVEE